MRIPINWLKEYIDTKLGPVEIAQKLTMVGHALDKPIYEQEGDTIIDLEDRGNRADTIGIIGIARELSALTDIKLKYPKEAAIPKVDNVQFSPKITVDSDKVTRWTAVTFKNVKVGPSPDYIQKRLRAYGIEVINNIVDITNYVMIETGMPLHAFDTDKLKEIVLRSAKKGETLVTFEGTELKFDEEDLLAADIGKPLTLTTAVGGRETGISETTTNILIEAGLYHQPTARRSAIKHNVRNETSARLGKYLHPNYCQVAIGRSIELMKEILDVSPGNISFDYYPVKYEPKITDLTQKRLNLIAGTEISLETAVKNLEKLEFRIMEKTKDKITVEIPYFRTDVTMEDDLVEEVLRISGYDTLPSYLPERPSPPKLDFPEMDLENSIRDILVRLGFNEVVSQQIVDINDVKKTGLLNESKVVTLENSWNQELNVMRPEYVSPQLKYLSSYVKHQAAEPIRIFEIGKTYTKETGEGYEKYKETRKAVFSSTLDFNSLKAALLTLLSELGIETVNFEKIDFAVFKKEGAAKVMVNGEDIGKIGEIKRGVLESFNLLPNQKTLSESYGLLGLRVSHVVLHVSKLLKYAKKEVFPKIETFMPNYISEDFTFIIDSKEEVGKLRDRILCHLDPTDELNFVGIYTDEKLNSQGKKSVTFNIKFTDSEQNKNKEKSDKIKSAN